MSTKLKYNFQSVGELGTVLDNIERRRNKQSDKGRPVSIKTPMQFAETSGDLFEMHNDQITAIRDNMRNLITTNHGERLGHFDFGANLITVVHELGSEDGDRTAMALISRTVSKYMPFVTLEGYESKSTPVDGSPLVSIILTFTVRSLDPEGRHPQQIETLLSFDG